MKVAQLQELLKAIPAETDIFIGDTDTDWVLEIESITKGEKAIYIRGDYNLQTSSDLDEDFRDSKDYLYKMEKEEFLQKTEKWYGKEEVDRREKIINEKNIIF